MSINPVGFNNNTGRIFDGTKSESAPPIREDSVSISGKSEYDLGIPDLGPVAKKKGLLRFFGVGRMKPEEGYEGVQKMGKAISEGKMTKLNFAANADNLKEQMKATCRMKDEENSSAAIVKSMFNRFKGWQDREEGKPFSSEGIAELLTSKAGFKDMGEGRLSLNFKHHFDMDYDAQGRFRGSRSYDAEGKTTVMAARILQTEGATERDPAAIIVNFERPGHMGLSLEGTPFAERSSSSSIFFVDAMGKIKGLQGLITDRDTITHLAQGQENMKILLNSLNENSLLQFHDYGVGYGEVGTSYHNDVKIPEIKEDMPIEHKSLAGIASLDHILKEKFGVS